MKKIFLLSVLLLLPALASASSISISSPAASYKTGQTFSVTVSVNPNGEAVDTVRANLSFPADKLKVESFALSPMFSYQSGSNGFDNTVGTLSWGAGVPGGITSPTVFGTAKFKVIKDGNANVAVTGDSLVLVSGANKFDGQSASLLLSLLPVASVPSRPMDITAPPSEKPKTTIEPAAKPDVKEYEIDTQILPKKIETKSPSSLLGVLFLSVSMRQWIVLSIVAALLLMLYVMKKIIKETEK